MCGITGFFSYKNKIDTKKYYRAHKKIAHRGPDDEGFIYKNKNNKIERLIGDDTINELKNREFLYNKEPSNLILGHRRLSIIDLTSAGHQPFVFENLYLVYNGEIYNYIELKNELKKVGYNFKTNSDTEVFLKAYHYWGVEAFNKFNGMWAAAIYDSKKDEILLTRDRFGIKPLYYSVINNNLIFGSEVKFIKDFITVTLNQKVIENYIRKCYLNYNHETFYNEVYELEPSFYISYNKKGIEKKQYWNYYPHIDEQISFEQARKTLKKLLNNSIDIRMRSDVEIGSLLSGGIDSNVIIGNLYFRGKIKNKFQVFSAVFEDEKFSEKKYIDITLKYIPNLKGHFIYPDANELKRYLKEILYYQEFPFRSLAVFSQYKIYNKIKNDTKIKVLLNGQGSDEQFAGYGNHYQYLLADYLTNFKLRLFIKELKYYKKFKKKNVLKEFFNIMKIIIKNKFKRNSLMQNLFNEYKISPMREYLRYEDRNSMMASLEARLPFMDYKLIEYSLTLKNEFKIHNGISKYILRESMQNYIHKDILNRKDKVGFFAPHESWQRHELKDFMLEIFYKYDFKILKSINVKKIVLEYFNGKNEEHYFVWRCFCFLYWRECNEI